MSLKFKETTKLTETNNSSMRLQVKKSVAFGKSWPEARRVGIERGKRCKLGTIQFGRSTALSHRTPRYLISLRQRRHASHVYALTWSTMPNHTNFWAHRPPPRQILSKETRRFSWQSAKQKIQKSCSCFSVVAKRWTETMHHWWNRAGEWMISESSGLGVSPDA